MSSSDTPLLDPLQQQQPPPTVVAAQQASTAHSGHGSVGPVIGVLAVIIILGSVAVVIGRLCSGRRSGRYDFEEWAETKCASCIDGRVFPPPPPPPPPMVAEHSVSSSSSDDAPAMVPQEETQTHEEDKVQEQQSHLHN